MSQPIALGRPLPLSPLSNDTRDNFKNSRMNWGANALTAPTTPDHRLPVIDKTKEDPQMRAAAEGMEGMFLDYMMKTMRETVPKNDMDGDSPATGIYQGMMDSEMAQKAVRAGGVGLADQLVAYLEGQRYTLGRQEHAAPDTSASTGGTHADQPTRK